mgnify:CR=1 FL=1
MPIPKPTEIESKDMFIQRCMTDNVMRKEYSDIKQRIAVCGASYEEGK